MTPSPPQIFSPARRLAARRRALRRQGAPGAARFLIDDMTADVIERIDFLRVTPARALIVGDYTGVLAAELTRRGADVTAADPAEGFAEEQPWQHSGFDFIASLGTLDTVNDLPGALIHLHRALAPDGLALASFVAAGSLPTLRAALLAADGDRPAPRLHPMVDVRAGGQLLQRAGWANPVVDSRSLEVSYRTLGALIEDLRAQGLTNVLARPGPPLGRAALAASAGHFAAAGSEGRTTERLEILTLSGWRRSA